MKSLNSQHCKLCVRFFKYFIESKTVVYLLPAWERTEGARHEIQHCS